MHVASCAMPAGSVAPMRSNATWPLSATTAASRHTSHGNAQPAIAGNTVPSRALLPTQRRICFSNTHPSKAIATTTLTPPALAQSGSACSHTHADSSVVAANTAQALRRIRACCGIRVTVACGSNTIPPRPPPRHQKKHATSNNTKAAKPATG